MWSRSGSSPCHYRLVEQRVAGTGADVSPVEDECMPSWTPEPSQPQSSQCVQVSSEYTAFDQERRGNDACVPMHEENIFGLLLLGNGRLFRRSVDSFLPLLSACCRPCMRISKSSFQSRQPFLISKSPSPLCSSLTFLSRVSRSAWLRLGDST